MAWPLYFQVAEGHNEGDSFREALRNKDFTFDFSFWTVDREDKERYHCQETVSLYIAGR